jgi:hypothetical protein
LHKKRECNVDILEGELKNSFIPSGKLMQKYCDNEIISKISSKFIEIYNQAFQAEHYGLDLICGAGYRKAFEYLIKDYVSETYVAEKDKIQKMPLSSVIETYISDMDVKELARRAAWVGNDETHTLRKWEELKLEDLKNLIDLTVAYIEKKKKAEIYLGKMQIKK